MIQLSSMAKVIIEHLEQAEINIRGIQSWPIWEKEISRFDWLYEGDEECLIIEGEVIVETEKGSFSIKKGDFVTFKNGLKCVWNIKKPIRKYYNFP